AHGLLEQDLADASTAVARRDHEPEVGDVLARGMWVARERKAPDDLPVVFDHEDRGVGVPLHGFQVAPLLSDRAPARRRQDPAFLPPPPLLREGQEPRGRLRPRTAYADHRAATPPPPPRGSAGGTGESAGPRPAGRTAAENRLRPTQRTT